MRGSKTREIIRSTSSMGELTVKEMHGVDSIDALRAEWQALFRESDAPPFLSWEWIAAWQQWLSRGRTPFLLCARHGSKLVGLLPLGIEELRPLGLPVKARWLSLLGEGFGCADYLDVLALPEYAPEASSAIFDHLDRKS